MKTKKSKELWVNFVALIIISILVVLILKAQPAAVQLLPPTQIYVPAAINITQCTQAGCTNATREGNYTLMYNITSYGYLVFNSTNINNAGIGIVVWEKYAKGIPQNKQYQFQLYGVQHFSAAYSEMYLNASTNPAVIPIAPGYMTIKLYNPQPNPTAFNMSIEDEPQ
jgi:hypothetical protein